MFGQRWILCGAPIAAVPIDKSTFIIVLCVIVGTDFDGFDVIIVIDFLNIMQFGRVRNEKYLIKITDVRYVIVIGLLGAIIRCANCVRITFITIVIGDSGGGSNGRRDNAHTCHAIRFRRNDVFIAVLLIVIGRRDRVAIIIVRFCRHSDAIFVNVFHGLVRICAYFVRIIWRRRIIIVHLLQIIQFVEGTIGGQHLFHALLHIEIQIVVRIAASAATATATAAAWARTAAIIRQIAAIKRTIRRREWI